MDSLNGVLLPGGQGNYTQFGFKVMDYVKEKNDNGTFYPAWGTCYGFELMAKWASSSSSDLLTELPAHNINLPLDFNGSPASMKMF